jgi:hypothetical protein
MNALAQSVLSLPSILPRRLTPTTIVALALAFSSAFTQAHAAAAEPAPAAGQKQPIPIPAGYDFPAAAAKLEALVKARDEAGIRRHGWYLWAAINQPGRDGWPLWRSWDIATQAFAPATPVTSAAGAPSATAGATGASHPGSLKTINVKNNPTINLQLPYYLIPEKVRAKHREALQGITDAANIPDGDNFQNNGDLMLVSEAYSLIGYQNIRDRKLFEQATLNALLAEGKTDIPDMDPKTVVLKHMYWPVKRDGLTALPVANMELYDQPANPDTTYIGFENMSRWTKAVAIDPTAGQVPPVSVASVTYLYDVLAFNPGQTGLTPPPLGPHTYKEAKVVPITDFYYKKLSAQDYEALSTYDKVLLDASFYWVTGRLFEPGDYLVSVASHVITKEMPSWTLQTAWWHDEPDQSPYAKDRPEIPDAKGPWRHYLLASEYGITAQPGGDSLPITYNPFIELASHPVITNCRNCHIRSSWQPLNYINPTGPDALANIQRDNPLFKGHIRADFLWTIPDRAQPPKSGSEK